MSYNPQQGLFVNGRVANATEVLNEFNAISVAITDVDNKVDSSAAQTEQTAKKYTDAQLADTVVDGGTF